MSKFFINRPIFASVISIIIVIAGLVASRVLPIAQYPQIAPPTVLITATYPGASAETLAKTVAAPIEEQLNGVENLLYFTSSAAANGVLTITATFDVGTNVDIASVNVNNRVKTAEARLPEEVRRNGVIVQKRSNDILQVVALESEKGRYSTLLLSNYASLNIADELKRIKGVGDVTIFGAQDYSMRVWLNPDRMAQLGLTTSEVSAAIKAKIAQNEAGKIGKVRKPFETLLYADGGTRPNQYPGGSAPLDNTEILAYTTNFNSTGPYLWDVFITPWLGNRIPLERHGGKKAGGLWQNAKINVVFCDGHAETVLLGNFRLVRVSPW